MVTGSICFLNRLASQPEENEEVQHQEGAGRLDSGVLVLLRRSVRRLPGERRRAGDSPVGAFPALQGGFFFPP